jgi:protein TonB
MNEYALHAPADHTALRWIGSAVVIVALHAGLIVGGLAWYRDQVTAGSEMPAIMVDMAPASAAPEVSQQDAPPGPEMQQAEAPSEPPPEPVQPQQMEEQVAPTPPVEKPEVEAPPEQKIEPAPPPPEPAKVTPEPPKPAPEKPTPKPVRAEVKKKPSETPPAPRTTAPPRADRQAAAASAARAGAAAAAAALPSYRDRLNAHLQRYKQASTDGKQGVATLSFTVSRSGQVLGSRISGSSGVPELDAATMALIRRAQPLPPFPPELTQTSMSFSVPIRYLNR